MFSTEEKKIIAAGIEAILLSLKHPEMPSDKPDFRIHIEGKEAWSWADIVPNWKHEANGSPRNPNPFNELAKAHFKRFKKPTDGQIADFAILVAAEDRDFTLEKLSSMVALCIMVVDRLYENGDIDIPSKSELEDEEN